MLTSYSRLLVCLHANKVYIEDGLCWWMTRLLRLIKQLLLWPVFSAGCSKYSFKTVWGFDVFFNITTAEYGLFNQKLHPDSWHNFTLTVFPWAAFLWSLIDVPGCAIPDPLKYKTICFSYYVPNLACWMTMCTGFQCSSSTRAKIMDAILTV